MTEVIEINHISPTSDYVFNKEKKYYLVFIYSGKSNNVTINKMEIKNINNITDTIRSYHIGRAIQLLPYFSIKLFEYDYDKIKLMFTGFINLENLEYGVKVINLAIPSKVVGSPRTGVYDNDISFLQEQFFNFESMINDKCLLFISKTKSKTVNPIIKPSHFNFDDKKDTYIYDRYNSTIIREQNFVGLDNFCQSNTFNDYVKFVKLYNIDVNKYTNKQADTFKNMFMRKINQQFRPLNYDPYLNNVICSPVDGRVIGFNNVNVKNAQYKSTYFSDFIEDKEFINASGFINRMAPYDYQRIYMPYAGYLTGIEKMNNCIIFKFESDYFIPPNIHEREYVSVVHGHNIQMSREYPELVKTQPKTKLIFYLALFSNKTNDSIIFTNTNLINIRQTTYTKKIKVWLEQGEELGAFNCCLGTTLILFNREIKFADDINSQMECYIKTKDLIKLIQ